MPEHPSAPDDYLIVNPRIKISRGVNCEREREREAGHPASIFMCIYIHTCERGNTRESKVKRDGAIETRPRALWGAYVYPYIHAYIGVYTNI